MCVHIEPYTIRYQKVRPPYRVDKHPVTTINRIVRVSVRPVILNTQPQRPRRYGYARRAWRVIVSIETCWRNILSKPHNSRSQPLTEGHNPSTKVFAPAKTKPEICPCYRVRCYSGVDPPGCPRGNTHNRKAEIFRKSRCTSSPMEDDHISRGDQGGTGCCRCSGVYQSKDTTRGCLELINRSKRPPVCAVGASENGAVTGNIDRAFVSTGGGGSACMNPGLNQMGSQATQPILGQYVNHTVIVAVALCRRVLRATGHRPHCARNTGDAQYLPCRRHRLTGRNDNDPIGNPGRERSGAADRDRGFSSTDTTNKGGLCKIAVLFLCHRYL